MSLYLYLIENPPLLMLTVVITSLVMAHKS